MLAPGQATADGNVLTGAGTAAGIADLQGADGGVTVVGVAAGNGPGGAAPGTVGVAIAGARGTLTVNADGSYSYVVTGGGGNDVFTYTIRDSDGSLSHATLTINLGDAAPSNIIIPPTNTPGQTQVFEAGLGPRGTESAGSHTGDPSFPATTAGTITFSFFGARVDFGQNAGRMVLHDQHRRKDESGNVAKRPLERLNLQAGATGGTIEQGDREAIVLDRKTGQQGLARDRATVKRGEEEKRV